MATRLTRWLLVLGLAVVSGWIGGGAAAQAGAAGEPPSPLALVRAFDLVDPWVRELAVPEDAVGEAVGGACVTVRLRGSVLARGQAIGLGDQTLPQAARLAIEGAMERLPVINSADADAARRLLAAELCLTIELSGDPIPVDAASYTELSAMLNPGIDAIAVRIGDAADAVFPIEMMTTTQQAGGAASRLVGRVTGNALLSMRQPAELAEAGFFRLRTVACAQLEPSERPLLLDRGGRRIPMDEVSLAGMENAAEDLVAFLVRHESVGVYGPVNDAPLEGASPSTQALSALAIARAAEVLDAPPEQRDRLRDIADRMLTVAERDAFDTATIGLVIGARCVLDGGGVDPARLRLLWEPADDLGQGSRTRTAIVAWAYAMAGRPEQASELLSELRRVEHPGQLVGVMPWFGWAEMELAGAGELPSAVALRQMREVVQGFQMRSSDTGIENLDLVGGVVFTSGAAPLPTWQSARAMSFLATMLRDRRLTEAGELEAQTAALVAGTRFLLQLTETEAASHMYRAPARAMGGARAAPWDQTMPIEASAFVLLALVESIETLRELDARDGVRNGGEAGDGG
ncbi:MAG: hypothetical protein ACTS22_05400 [Phycisphaerales bacterium]